MSIRKREASTTVELPSGGSIVIAGLVQDNIRQAMSGLPGLSKVPVLGTLFRSKDFQRNETETRHHRNALSGAAGGTRCPLETG